MTKASLAKPSLAISDGSIVSKHSCEDCRHSWRVQSRTEPPNPLGETPYRRGCVHPDVFGSYCVLGVSLKAFGTLIPDITDIQPAEHCVDFSKFKDCSRGGIMSMPGLPGATGTQGATGAQGATGTTDPQAWGNPE